MLDVNRQEAISDPVTIFKKLRDKADKKPVRERGSRIRERIKASTTIL